MEARTLADVGFWASIFFGNAWLLFSTMYTLVLFGDLFQDDVNIIDFCSQVNQLRWPEYLSQASIFVALMLRGHYVAAALNAPILFNSIFASLTGTYLLDNTTAFSQLPKERRYTIGKLVLLLIVFCVYLYGFIDEMMPRRD